MKTARRAIAMNVGVIGATGYVGGRLVPALLAEGHRVRCLARTPSRLDGVPWRADVEVAPADVGDWLSLYRAFHGLDAVYYLVHAMGHTKDFERADRIGAFNTRVAAEETGVGRLVYLGGLGVDDPFALSHHLASRHEVGRVLAAGDPRWAGGTVLEDVRSATTTAAPETVFATVAGVGGDRGWYSGNRLWAARGWIDKLLGGVGMRRGRRHPDELRAGDALDFFRVEVCEPPRLLRLRAEMKLPGRAWLEWQVSSGEGGTTVLHQRARFNPRGVAGRAYWWLLLLPHAVIWRRLLAGLVRSAEEQSTDPRPAVLARG